MGCASSSSVHPVLPVSSPTVSGEPPVPEDLTGLKEQLRKLGIPTGAKKTKAELESLLSAFAPVKAPPAAVPPPPASPSSSSSSLSLSSPTRRRSSFSEVRVSGRSAKLLRSWVTRARMKLQRPELPRLPPTANQLTARRPQYLKVGGEAGRPSFFDSLKDERQNLINTQTVKVQLAKVLPDQTKPKTVGTPGFGKATPGFGVVAGTPFLEGPEEQAATPLPTPRAPEVTPRGGSSPPCEGGDEGYPSSPEAKRGEGGLVEGTNFTVGGFEFCAGETVEWGKKRGKVVGVSRDAKDVRVRHEETGKLLKIPPDRLVRVELKIGRLFDIFNNSSFD